MTQENDALLPCPFCGSSASITHEHGTYEPGCNHCGISIGMYSSERSAITTWNRRASLQPAKSATDGGVREPLGYISQVLVDFPQWKTAHISDTKTESRTVPLYTHAIVESADQENTDQQTVLDYEEVLTDHRRLVRELDVLLNGDACAKQASLCDIVGQVKREGIQSENYIDAHTAFNDPVERDNVLDSASECGIVVRDSKISGPEAALFSFYHKVTKL